MKHNMRLIDVLNYLRDHCDQETLLSEIEILQVDPYKESALIYTKREIMTESERREKQWEDVLEVVVVKDIIDIKTIPNEKITSYSLNMSLE